MHEQEREERNAHAKAGNARAGRKQKWAKVQNSQIASFMHGQSKTQCASSLDWLDNETSRRWLTFLQYYLVNIGLRRVLFQMFASQGVVVRPCKSA